MKVKKENKFVKFTKKKAGWKRNTAEDIDPAIHKNKFKRKKKFQNKK